MNGAMEPSADADLILYQTEDDQARIQYQLEDGQLVSLSYKFHWRENLRGLSRALQQKPHDVTRQSFFDLSMPWHRLRNARHGIPIPIMLATVAHKHAATLLKSPDQIRALHGMTNSPTLRAPGTCPPERSA